MFQRYRFVIKKLQFPLSIYYRPRGKNNPAHGVYCVWRSAL